MSSRALRDESTVPRVIEQLLLERALRGMSHRDAAATGLIWRRTSDADTQQRVGL